MPELETFSAFVSRLSQHQTGAMQENNGVSGNRRDVLGGRIVSRSNAGSCDPMLFQQEPEIPAGLETISEEGDEVLETDILAAGEPPGAMPSQAVPEPVAPDSFGHSILFKGVRQHQMLSLTPQQDLRTMPSAEVHPKPSTRVIMENGMSVLGYPADGSVESPPPAGLETGGKPLVPGMIRSPLAAAGAGVQGSVEDSDGFRALLPEGRQTLVLTETDAPLTRRSPAPSAGGTLMVSFPEKGQELPAGLFSRGGQASGETSEKTPVAGTSAPTGQDPGRIIPLTGDGNPSDRSGGNQSARQGFLFEHAGFQQNPGHPSALSTVPGTFQKNDPETLSQLEKMDCPPAGTPVPGTVLAERIDSLEASRLPLESPEMRTLTDIIQKAVWRQENGQSQVRIQLKPAFLGHMHLNVVMDQLKITVEIRTETHLARDFLESNLHMLRVELKESGLEIGKISVLVDPDLNSGQDQGRSPAHAQTHPAIGFSKEMEALGEENQPAPGKRILSNRGENRVDCFV